MVGNNGLAVLVLPKISQFLVILRPLVEQPLKGI